MNIVVSYKINTHILSSILCATRNSGPKTIEFRVISYEKKRFTPPNVCVEIEFKIKSVFSAQIRRWFGIVDMFPYSLNMHLRRVLILKKKNYYYTNEMTFVRAISLVSSFKTIRRSRMVFITTLKLLSVRWNTQIQTPLSFRNSECFKIKTFQ